MGLLDWLRRAFLPLKRVDPVFGSMRFQRIDGPNAPGYWECAGTFLGREVEFFVDAGEEGPSELQREQARRLAARWPELEARLARFLAERRGSVELGPRSPLLADWELASFSWPVDPRLGPGFEIGYTAVGDGELLTFEMEGAEPRAVRVGA